MDDCNKSESGCDTPDSLQKASRSCYSSESDSESDNEHSHNVVFTKRIIQRNNLFAPRTSFRAKVNDSTEQNKSPNEKSTTHSVAANSNEPQQVSTEVDCGTVENSISESIEESSANISEDKIDKDMKILNNMMSQLMEPSEKRDEDDVSVSYSTIYGKVEEKASVSNRRRSSKVVAEDGVINEEYNVYMSEKAKEMLDDKINSSKSIREKNFTAMTSEELKLRKLEEEKEEERRRMKKYREHYLKLRKNGFHSSHGTCKSKTVKKLTIPKSPPSLLDKKFGKKYMKAIEKKKESEKQSHAQRKLSVTIPEPFHFATDERMKNSDTCMSPKSPRRLQSMTAAELALRFQQDTRNYQLPVACSLSAHAQNTEPHSPILHTKERAASIKQRSSLISQAEREEQLMKEMREKQFKALKLNYKMVFESNGEFGVPKVQSKESTVPQNFVLRSQVRAEEHQKKLQSADAAEEKEEFKFRARKMPEFHAVSASNKCVSVKRELTVPESPKFHGKERASSAPPRRQLKSIREQQLEKQQEKDSWRQREPMKLTEPKEFELLTTARGESYKQQFLNKIQQEQEQLEREYFKTKALPMPDLNKHFEVKHAHKSMLCTEIREFQLKSLQKHEEYMNKLNEMILQEIEQEMQQTSFKALKLNKQILAPRESNNNFNKHSSEQIVQPMNIVLESDKRAAKRKEFDEEVARKQHEMQIEQEKQRQQQREREESQLKALRRKSVEEGGLMFKAREIMKEDPYVVHTSAVNTKQPTIPKSPKLHLKERRASQNNSKQQAAVEKENEKNPNIGKTVKSSGSFNKINNTTTSAPAAESIH